jgi:GNAT superfamily N-acetyltransferase
MNDLQIRDARDTDRDAIQSVTLSAYEQYAALMVGVWEFYRANILATLADVSPAEQIVAWTDDGIVGTVLLYPAGTQFKGPDGTLVNLIWPEIRLLAVVPTARGQGIATALVQQCVRRARQSGAAALVLHTTDMMKTAVHIYEQMGFVRVPALDFSPAEGQLVKGYRLDLNKLTS